MEVTYSSLCSFKPFRIETATKKRPFQKCFRGNPSKAEISNTSGSKQALETSSTRYHKILWPSFAKMCNCCLSSTPHF